MRIVILATVIVVSALVFQIPLLASADPIISLDGWELQNPLPQENNLNAIWGNSSSDIFAVGDVGTILLYDNGSWIEMDSTTTSWLHGVWGSSSTGVYAVGEGGTILHYPYIASTGGGCCCLSC